MIDNYFNHLENMIRPKELNVHDILRSRQGDVLSSDGEVKSFKTSGSAKSSQILKKSEIVNRSHQESNLNRSSSKLSIKNIDDITYLKQLLNEEMKKNMNLRHEIQILNSKINLLENKQNDYLKTINSIKFDKEMNSKYILKMETMVKNLTNENKDIKKIKEVPIVENSNEKFLIDNLNQEIEKLELFRQHIYETSKTYDEINLNIYNSLKDIQLLFVGMNKELDEDKFNHYDFKTLDRFKSKIKFIFSILRKNDF
jgi:hypothetical protein